MRKYAFLFGNSFFNDTRLNELNAPENDINALHDVLKAKDICAFDDVDWAVNSTLGAVQTKLVKFLKNKKRDDLIVVYYTGHGLLDDENNLYLALTESNAEYPDIQSISAAWLKRKLDRCRSERQVLILDCCHSGAFIGGTKSSTDTLAINTDTFDRQGYGRYVLASSSRTQFSIESGGESLYTKAIVEGLKKGKAALGKEWISIADLEEYLAGKFSTAAAPMRPESSVKEKIGQLVIAANPFFVEPIPPNLLESLLDKSSIVRTGAVTGLQMLAENTSSSKRREEVIEVLEARLNPDSPDVEDSRTVAKAIERALAELKGSSESPTGMEDTLQATPGKSSNSNEEPTLTADKHPEKIRFFSWSRVASLLAFLAVGAVGLWFWVQQPDEGFDPKPEIAQGAITDVERKMTKADLQRIQQIICLKPDGIFGPETRGGIRVFKETQGISPANGEISNMRELQALQSLSSCNNILFSNYLEREKFSGKEALFSATTSLCTASLPENFSRSK